MYTTVNILRSFSVSRKISSSSLVSGMNGRNVQRRLQSHMTPKKVKLVIPQQQTAKVVWNDETAADLHYIWLRDNCHCPSCVHPDTHQKLLDTPELPLDITAKKVMVADDGSVTITWENDGHTSTFNSEWLQNKTLRKNPEKNNFKLPQITPWNSDILNQKVSIFRWSDLESNDPIQISKWLSALYEYGIVFVKDTPPIKNQVLEVGKKISYIKETSYGLLFDVRNEPSPTAHLAYTGRELKHHTDMNYREKSPGIQLLHCLKADAQGGANFFVDGFYVAEWLRKTNPSAFHLLSSVEVTFQIKNPDAEFSERIPIIQTDKSGKIQEVHVNNRTMDTSHLSPEVVMPFYAAYKTLNDKIREQSSEFYNTLKSGDVVIFNNRRILHGRTSFDPNSGVRHYQGCYVDYDEFLSKLQVLGRKL